MQRTVDDQAGHPIHHMLEIKFGDAIALEIRRGIQEVDGVRNAIFDRELDGIHFVAECLIDGLRVLHDTRAQFGLKVIMFDQIAALLRIVGDRDNIRFAEREAADILCRSR